MHKTIQIITVFLGLCMALSSNSWAEKNNKELSKQEIREAMKPHTASVLNCYKIHTANQKVSGKFTVELLIHHKGFVQKIWTLTPTVKGYKVADCIEKLSYTWDFPKKTGSTNTITSYHLLKTHSEGAGPYEGCYDAKGCPSKKDEKK